MHPFAAAVVAAAIVTAASGMTREADAALERLPFEAAAFTPAGAVITDAAGPEDIVVFDRGTDGPVPGAIVDLTSVDVTPAHDGWHVVFRFAKPLPAEPSYPINIDLFVDADGDPGNNAQTGVFRAGADRAFLLLFGTRTAWHTQTWTYAPATDRWAELTTPVAFTVGEREVTLTIPSTVLPAPPLRGARARAFALTSTGGITAVDVAPGTGLPPVRVPHDDGAAVQSAPRVPLTTAIPVVLAVFFGISVFLWRKGSVR